MNFFGIGWEEMLVIMVVALIVFGPGKLPEVMGQVGKAIRDFRRMTSDLQGEFEKTIGGSLDDVKQQIQGELTGITSQVTNVTESVRRDLNQTTADLVGAAGSSPASSTTTAAAPGAGTVVASVAAAATKADPLADVSLLEDAVRIGPAPTNGHSEEVVAETVVAADTASDQGAPAGVTATEAVSTETVVVEAPGTNGNGHEDDAAVVSDDALSRARQRRLAAGYNRRVR